MPTVVIWLVLIIALGLSAYALFETMRLKGRLAVFFKGAKAESLEEKLSDAFTRLGQSDLQIQQIKDQLEVHSGYLERAFQHIGLVRFNPFGDTGGDQSFSLALLDQAHTGIVVTSMHGRASTRVYAKPINNGVSKYNLSEEETSAIKQAINS